MPEVNPELLAYGELAGLAISTYPLPEVVLRKTL